MKVQHSPVTVNIYKITHLFCTYSLQPYCLVHRQSSDSGKRFLGCELILQEQTLHQSGHSIQKHHTPYYLKISKQCSA